MKIKRLLAINVPIKACNFKCDYCYIRSLSQDEVGPVKFEYTPEHVQKCLSKERLGGICIINLTGGGETLIPEEIPDYIYCLLKEGHFLEVVTNGTITKRFQKISTFPRELLERLEFKFSFHYRELLRLNLLNVFFDNIRLMKSNGCSFTVELMPYDGLINDVNDIMKICESELGALCHTTVGRNDLTKGKEFLTSMSKDDYVAFWNQFNSDMFKFKLDIFNKKINKFCYAGAWSLYIDLGTGSTKQCYGQIPNQNVFKDYRDKIVFEPVGFHCRQPYCYNGHAFLTLGMVPEIDTPPYASIRNRTTVEGNEWLTPLVKEAFSAKLYENNIIWSPIKKFLYEIKYPIKTLSKIIYARKEIGKIIFGKLRRK